MRVCASLSAKVAAPLAQVLKLDPAIQLEPITAELALLTLVDPGVALDSLVVRALGHRPELQKSRAELTAARKSLSRSGVVFSSTEI